jgi:uncharacterized protein
MMVVLDTNVLIGALLSSKGSPAEVIRRWEADDFGVITSPSLISEFERALTYPRVRRLLNLSQEQIDVFLKRLRTVATVVDPQITLAVIEKDPDDNRLLECAVADQASYVVSGDDHLLDLGEYAGIVILNPMGFVTALKLRRQ